MSDIGFYYFMVETMDDGLIVSPRYETYEAAVEAAAPHVDGELSVVTVPTSGKVDVAVTKAERKGHEYERGLFSWGSRYAVVMHDLKGQYAR